MRILHLIPGLMTGGQETMLINIANEQVKEHNVFVVIINKDYDKRLIELFDKKVKIICINRPRSSKNPWYFIKLNWIILKQNPFVVHSHYEKQAWYLIKLGYKFVYTVHGFTIPPKHLRVNKNLVAISRGIQKDTWERAKVKSTVIYNGLKIDSFAKKQRVEPYTNQRDFRIVQVSRLFYEIKGQDILIRAVALLKEKGYTNLSVDFIGEGASKNYLEELTKSLKLDNIYFLGTKTVGYISANLKNYDLFVLASRFEGFGLTVAEAMAAKIPVVVSDSDGPMEVIDNGKYGLSFQNESVEDCAARIEEILNMNVETLQNHVDEAWGYVNTHFNIKNTADNYIRFYKECE